MSAAQFSSSCASAGLRGPLFPPPRCGGRRSLCSAVPSGNSYLDMWKKAMERKRRAQQSRGTRDGGEGGKSPLLEAKTECFNQLLQVPTEERDRVQRLQVIDRAAAACAAARAILNESPVARSTLDLSERPEMSRAKQGLQHEDSFLYQSVTLQNGPPGPDFWSWSPPSDTKREPIEASTGLRSAPKLLSQIYPSNLVIEKEKTIEFLAIPMESTLFGCKHNPPHPPLQSLVEVDKVGKNTTLNASIAAEEKMCGQLFSGQAVEVAEALSKSTRASEYGMDLGGSQWWRETGIEERPDGVVCKWTLTRGVSADETVEWEDKFWEAADQYDYKELGSEKSGRDASGNVWREYWKESMWQDMRRGIIHMENTADKWGKNGKGDEWQEKWWEHYDSSGYAEKWAHKWCSIEPKTPLEAGHAHVWHERWGEKYDGNGGSMKYTDKWAERSEGDGWSKWGDKWDEHFDSNGHGVKQGETWWEGAAWGTMESHMGEWHNGSGWVHKYGKSSNGEHWDTHVQQETWSERFPHYGFEHCFENSVHLRAVCKPLDTL